MNTNFNEICRLCLRFCDKYIDLNQTNGVKTLANDIVEKIKYCYVVQIDLSEGLPTKICYNCIQVLSLFHAAKKNVLISEQLLRDVLFVRKKLQEETRNFEEMMLPDIIEIKQISEKNEQTVVPQNIDLEKSDKKNVTVIDVELDSSECVNTSQINAIPIVDVETGNTVTVFDKPPISIFDNYDSRLKDKNKLVPEEHVCSEIRRLLTTNDDIKTLVSLKDSKRKGRYSRNMKGELQKRGLRISLRLKENIKEIGTVIDTRNILSPDVKRSRKI